MNMLNNRARKFEDDDFAEPHMLEDKEVKRLVAEREDMLGKLKGLVFKAATAPATMPVEKLRTPSKAEAEISAPHLGQKIKEAIQTDYDPAESLAAIRAILLGPTHRLHDARIEEIVTILEETDRANQTSFKTLEHRCEAMSGKLDSELKKAADLQQDYMVELGRAVETRFQHFKSELDEKFEQRAAKSSSDMAQFAREMANQMKEQEKRFTTSIDAMTKRFEERFMGLDQQTDEVQQMSAQVFAEGLNDIAKRLTALRRR